MNAGLPVAVSVPSLAMDEAELIKVLSSSVYPGAELASIKLVISYCKAAHLDPLQKPVHIVPMDVKVKKERGNGFDYVKRDVIMPGIGLYRTQAARTGEYAGVGEPEFGPMVKQTLKKKIWEGEGQDRSSRTVEEEIEYPEWCRMTVKRLVAGRIVDFTSLEYWVENYATAGKDSTAPNAMWSKRKRGQLAKCTEAQCLRKAFPEVGAAPTAEEMEGKVIDADDINQDGTIGAKKIEGPKAKDPEPPAGNDQAAAAAGGAQRVEDSKDKDPGLTDGAKTTLRNTLKRYGKTEADLHAAGFPSIDAMPFSKFNPAMDWIKKGPAQT